MLDGMPFGAINRAQALAGSIRNESGPIDEDKIAMQADISTPYPDVVIEILQEIKRIGPYIMKIDVSMSMMHIYFSSDEAIWEMRQWGGNAIGSELITQFHCVPIE